MADYAFAPPRLSDEQLEQLRTAVAEHAYVDEQDALDHALECWRDDRTGFDPDTKLLLEERIRRGREAYARGEVFSVDEVFVELYGRLQARGGLDR